MKGVTSFLRYLRRGAAAVTAASTSAKTGATKLGLPPHKRSNYNDIIISPLK